MVKKARLKTCDLSRRWLALFACLYCCKTEKKVCVCVRGGGLPLEEAVE